MWRKNEARSTLQEENSRALTRKFPDKKALAAAILLSCVSIAAIPFIYLLVVKLRHKEKKEHQSRLDEFSIKEQATKLLVS